MVQEPLPHTMKVGKRLLEIRAYGLEVEVSGGPGTDVATVKVKAKAPVVSLPLIDSMKFEFTADAVMPMEKKKDEQDE